MFIPKYEIFSAHEQRERETRPRAHSIFRVAKASSFPVLFDKRLWQSDQSFFAAQVGGGVYVQLTLYLLTALRKKDMWSSCHWKKRSPPICGRAPIKAAQNVFSTRGSCTLRRWPGCFCFTHHGRYFLEKRSFLIAFATQYSFPYLSGNRGYVSNRDLGKVGFIFRHSDFRDQ